MENNIMEKHITEKHMERKKYEYWLHNLPGVGDRTIEKLLKLFGSAEIIYKAQEKELAQVILKEEQLEQIRIFKKNWDLNEKYHTLLNGNISFFTAEDEKYPEHLRKLIHPPYAVYCKGTLPPENKPAVALIGARECSGYGVCIAQAFGKAMALSGVPVISGMARGIDGISQQAALEANGQTWAVLGCGVDICYPASHKSLYDRILDTGGGILSVVPPGTGPAKRLFPERNRIVAGLCDVLLVVEARQKSGTWITVDMALEQGKNVYAVPGRLTDRLSDGCNMLIRQGAGIALSPEDLLAELKVIWNRKGGGGKSPNQEAGALKEKSKKNKIRKDARADDTKADKKTYWEKEAKAPDSALHFLDFHPKAAEQIWEEMTGAGIDKSLPRVMEELIAGCMEGRAKQVAGSYFAKNGLE